MLSDRDMCMDVSMDLKLMTMIEAVFATESSPNVKHVFLDQLRSHQDMQTQLLRLMEQRGWYPRVPGDLGYTQSWAAPYGSPWQAAGGAGGGAGVPGGPGATAWQPGAGGGTWQPPSPGAAWQNPLQTLGQNLREQR